MAKQPTKPTQPTAKPIAKPAAKPMKAQSPVAKPAVVTQIKKPTSGHKDEGCC